MPNSLPFEFMPKFKMLCRMLDTEIRGGRESVDPKDPLNKWQDTVSELLDSLGIAFQIEFGDDDVA